MITAIHKSMAAKRDAIQKDQQGFTLIELLVVVLIIGILSAIAIPVFLGQQEQAKDAAVKSDLSTAKTALISYATANEGTYLNTDGSQLTAVQLGDFGFVQSTNTTAIEVFANAAGAFCISGLSTTTRYFMITDGAGVTDTTGHCATVTGPAAPPAT